MTNSLASNDARTFTQAIVLRNRPKKLKPGGREREIMRLLPTWLTATVITVILVAIFVPVSYIIFASVNTDLNVANGEFFPSSVSLDSYVKVWKTVPLARGLGNSLLVAGGVAIICAALSIATAYVLVRYAFRGRLTILRSLVGFQSIPGTLVLLPLFVVFASIGTATGVKVIGSLWGLGLTYLTFALPFSTWVMVTYLQGLPRELEEAAAIDGASPLRILVRIIVPLSWPGIIVAAIFAFLPAWNDVLIASVMTRPETATAGVVLSVFGSGAAELGAIPQYSQIMAAALICAVPVVAIYLVFQRYLVSGLTAGGVK